MGKLFEQVGGAQWLFVEKDAKSQVPGYAFTAVQGGWLVGWRQGCVFISDPRHERPPVPLSTPGFDVEPEPRAAE